MLDGSHFVGALVPGALPPGAVGIREAVRGKLEGEEAAPRVVVEVEVVTSPVTGSFVISW